MIEFGIVETGCGFGINSNMTPKFNKFYKNIIKENKLIEESISADIVGLRDEHVRKFDDLLTIDWALRGYVFKDFNSWSEFEQENFQKNRSYETFSPDGYSSFDKRIGTINFYTEGLLPKRIKLFVSKIKTFLENHNFNFKIGELEKRDDKDDVIRIHILSNPEDDVEKELPPVIQYSNANMQGLFDTLGLHDFSENYGGVIDVGKIILLIKNVSNKERESNVRMPYHSDMEQFRNPDKEYNGPTMIDGGMSVQGIDSRLEKLYELAVWAKNNGYKEISFG